MSVTLQLLRLKLRLQGAVSTEWAFRSVWQLFTTPRRLPPKDWETAALAGSEMGVVAAPSGRIVTYTWNPAGTRTVLLVHGWEHRASFWGALAQVLAGAGFRVVALDGPAHGASDGKHTTLPEFAAAVETVAATLGQVHAAVAHSFGGAAVVGGPVQFNSAQSGRLPRLVLLAVPGSTAAVVQRFADVLRLPAQVVQRMLRHAQERHGRTSESFSITQAGVRFPVDHALLLHDTADASVPFAEAQTIVASWPALTFRRTHGLGHNRIMHDPEVAQQILAWLE